MNLFYQLVDRYSVKDLPSTEQDLSTWLKEIWAQKEKLLQEFYQGKNKGKFPGKVKSEVFSHAHTLFKYINTQTSIHV